MTEVGAPQPLVVVVNDARTVRASLTPVRSLPFAALGSIIMVNNAIPTLVLSPFLLIALYPRVKRWGLLWTEIMEPDEVSAGRLRVVANALMWIGGVGGLVVGLLLALGVYDQGLAAAGFETGGAGGIGIGLGLTPFLALIVASGFMLGGRDQVIAAAPKALAQL